MNETAILTLAGVVVGILLGLMPTGKQFTRWLLYRKRDRIREFFREKERLHKPGYKCDFDCLFK